MNALRLCLPTPSPPADIAARLSDKEAGFARDYFVLFGSHMKAAAANHLPGGPGRGSAEVPPARGRAGRKARGARMPPL